MANAAYFTQSRQRFTALLAVLVFFVGQTFLQQHVHVDAPAASDCVVCVQSDHAPLVQVAAPLPQLFTSTLRRVVHLPSQQGVAPVSFYPARAPPAI